MGPPEQEEQEKKTSWGRKRGLRGDKEWQRQTRKSRESCRPGPASSGLRTKGQPPARQRAQRAATGRSVVLAMT